MDAAIGLALIMSCGITASTLALHGFQGPLLPYEGRFGLFANCADRELLDIKLATAGLGETWEMMSVAIKPYPACHLTHSCIDAARYLSNTHQLSSENISKIIVRVASDSMPVVCEPLEEKRRPKSGYEAQFSLPYLVASAICRDRLALIDLEKEAYTDPVVINLCQRINCEPMDGSLYPAYFSGEVEVLTNDGESFIRREIINRGSDKTPITDAEIKKKYMENSKLALPSDMAEEIMGVVLNLDNCKSFNSLSSLLGKNINSNYITT